MGIARSCFRQDGKGQSKESKRSRTVRLSVYYMEREGGPGVKSGWMDSGWGLNGRDRIVSKPS
jgi:hypothetical protein